ncbi:MAG: uracil phosphoribosyltransferase [Gemmatimonadetes bacterium]|nr:uracil phosphoribosyltransferase [Gemmatimonadota bacterium]MCB9517683.1 uracil phosphoribosyltransferase [Gemmatimonadales bacterium]HRX19809.1 uracil phosphoribosyltransferase [Gemmatimonadales bacterium]
MPTLPPGVTILDHPLLADKLARLRATGTAPAAFAALVRQIAALMTWPATATLATREEPVTTPMEPMTGRVLARPVALVPILRAGLAMVDGFRDLIPEARTGHIGLYRDHDTLRAIPYYFKVPEPIADHDVLVLDPMLATGGSAIEAIRELKAAGAVRLTFCCLVAAPEGIARLHEAHPDVPIVAAALDRELNAHGYILPGLGDAGDRTFGTT